MNTALNIVDINKVAEADRKEIDTQIDQLISRHKGNRYEINKMVFESVSALTISENHANELASQGIVKRFWGGITGKNKQLQNKIDHSLAAAQYASQKTLQKLAEQNLMSFELITAVNNKLNASVIEIETEINNIYGTLVTFFKKTKSDIIQLENRIERLERNVNLLNWQNSIEYQMWNGVEYADLDTVSKIVCMVRDFYDITKGEWTTSDLLLLKSAMGIIGINPRELINCGAFIRALYMNINLCEKLFQGTMENEYVENWHVALASATNKGIMLQEKEHYIVQSVQKCLMENSVQTTYENIVDSLVTEYEKNEIFISPQANILIYDLMVELLYNLEQLNYIPSEIVEEKAEERIEEKLSLLEENYLLGNHKEAFEQAEELAKENCARAMFFLGEYYRFGYGNVVERDKNKGFEWHKKGSDLGEPLCKLQLSYQFDSNSIERKKIQEELFPILKELSENDDIVAQYEFAIINADEKEKDKWLEIAAQNGNWHAMHKLGVKYYGADKNPYDYFRAIHYFMKAKESHCADSIGYLGLMYDWGYGFQENKKEAFEWCEIAAKAGSIFSMRNLGLYYYNGSGCSTDYEKSKEWYRKAASLGDEDAKKALKEKFGIEV